LVHYISVALNTALEYNWFSRDIRNDAQQKLNFSPKSDNVGADWRHDMRLSMQLTNVSGADSKLDLTLMVIMA